MVVAKENMDLMTDIIQRFQHRKVRVVPGGSTRHRSICNGVLALGEGDGEEQSPTADRPKVVIIHDAVRPFVEEDFLYKIAMAAKEHGVSMSPAVLTKTHGNVEELDLLQAEIPPTSFELVSFCCICSFGQMKTFVPNT